MRSRTVGFVLVAVGIAATSTGVVGLIVDRRAPTRPSAASSPSPSPSVSTPAETPARFLDLLAASLRTGDVSFMLARLHPEVIRRFGTEACARHLTTLTDPTALFTVQQVSAPAPYEYKTDTRSTTIPDTLTVQVERRRQGQTLATALHLTNVQGQFRWYTDCGGSA